MEKLSIVVPCYNEEEVIEIFYKEIEKVKKKFSKKKVKLEVVFVDDGSSDKTLEIMKKLSKKERYINYISFSRNFGKEAAMLAGR